jgi:hypothetical protein
MSFKTKMKWNTTLPPKRTQKPLVIRYKTSYGKIRTGEFVFDKIEDTFVECNDDPDGIGLYKCDGYIILGWRDVNEKRIRNPLIHADDCF